MKNQNIILIVNTAGVIQCSYSTNSTRGRELAERDLKAHPEWLALYNGKEIKFVVGPYNDRVLDDESLPMSCRAKDLLGL